MARLHQHSSSLALNTSRAGENAESGSQRPDPRLPRGHHQQLAHLYARQGVRIFPCGPDKRPLIRNWNEEATDNLEQVRRWWRKLPHALVGLPCGPNHLFVVDVDRHPGGADGFRSIVSVMPQNAPFPPGMLSVSTPNNGVHLWFRMPTVPVKNSAGKLADENRYPWRWRICDSARVGASQRRLMDYQ